MFICVPSWSYRIESRRLLLSVDCPSRVRLDRRNGVGPRVRRASETRSVVASGAVQSPAVAAVCGASASKVRGRVELSERRRSVHAMRESSALEVSAGCVGGCLRRSLPARVSQAALEAAVGCVEQAEGVAASPRHSSDGARVSQLWSAPRRVAAFFRRLALLRSTPHYSTAAMPGMQPQTEIAAPAAGPGTPSPRSASPLRLTPPRPGHSPRPAVRG